MRVTWIRLSLAAGPPLSMARQKTLIPPASNCGGGGGGTGVRVGRSVGLGLRVRSLFRPGVRVGRSVLVGFRVRSSSEIGVRVGCSVLVGLRVRSSSRPAYGSAARCWSACASAPPSDRRTGRALSVGRLARALFLATGVRVGLLGAGRLARALLRHDRRAGRLDRAGRLAGALLLRSACWSAARAGRLARALSPRSACWSAAPCRSACACASRPRSACWWPAPCSSASASAPLGIGVLVGRAVSVGFRVRASPPRAASRSAAPYCVGLRVLSCVTPTLAVIKTAQATPATVPRL